MTRNTPSRSRWQTFRLIVLLALTVPTTVFMVRWISSRAAQREGATTVATGLTLEQTRQLDAAGQPFSAYAAVDPAIIPALEAAGSFAAPDPLTIIAASVPPIGVYLPATGNTQFELPPPTPRPVISPLPTVTRTPIPTLTPPPTFTAAPVIEPTLTPLPPTHLAPDGSAGPRVEAYGGDSCAPSGWPAAGVLTQYYHWYHGGIDIGVPLGTPTIATHSGIVTFAGWRTDGYGNLIIIENGAFITYYAHLTDFNVIEGQVVGRGSVIGWSGSTGNSTGPHIHYEVRINDSTVDPLTFESRGYPTC